MTVLSTFPFLGAFFLIIFLTIFAGVFTFLGGSIFFGLLGGLMSVPAIFVLFLILAIVLVKHRYDLAEYAATDQRLIQFGGTIGRDYST